MEDEWVGVGVGVVAGYSVCTCLRRPKVQQVGAGVGSALCTQG